jgi:thimet oligopeptidase
MRLLELPSSREGWFEFLAARCDDELSKAQQLADRLSAETTSSPLDDWNAITLHLLNATSAAIVVMRAHPDAEVRDRAHAAELAATTLGSRLRQDRRIYERLKAVDPDSLDDAAARTLRLTLRDFKRAGVDLDEEKRRELEGLVARCTDLAQQFERNIADGVRTVHLRSDQLEGLPADYIEAHPPGPDGTVAVTTTYPDVSPFLTFGRDRAARQELSTAFSSRAWPANDAVLAELLELRDRRARMLGYPSWPEYDAEVKMIGSGAAIADLLDDLGKAVKPEVEGGLAELEVRLQQDHPGERLTDADLAYYEEVLRRERFGVDKAEVRRYLGFDTVVAGLLDVTAELFDLEFVHIPDAEAWHPDVRTYDVRRDGQRIGRFHLDLHPRDGKYTHASHFALVRGLAGVQLPQSVLLCNLPRGLLLLGDVVVLFHEFGHLLHSILSGGLRWARDSGVATERDFVEGPAFLLEEWARNPRVLRRFAKDADGNPVPEDLLHRMSKADRLGRAEYIARMVALCGFAYEAHEHPPDDLTAAVEAALERHLPLQHGATHDHCSFTQMADERYGSGCYAYLLSYVIAKDMLTAFDPHDLMSPEPARKFRDRVLAAGGSRDGHDLVTDLLGRPLDTAAFHRWLSAST